MVRVSGPRALAVLKDLGRHGSAHKLTAVVLPLGTARLPVLVAAFKAPRSYTGEDLLEVQYTGNPALTLRLLDRLTSVDGVRLAQPGEFTARAYLAGKLSLAQAEGVAATIAATNHEQLEA